MSASSRKLDDLSQIKVLLMEKISPEAVKRFESEGFTVVQAVKYNEDELVEAIKDVCIIGVRSKTKLTERVLKAAERLLCVGCFCIGTDQTNLKVAAGMGIPTFNAPYANTRSVAELVCAEMVMMARQAGDRNIEMHRGEWNKKSANCFEVRGKTLGVIGYGHVGQQLSVLAEALGLHVVFYDIVPKLAMGNAKQLSTLDELLASSDFVSCHVPATPSTRKMMGREEIAKMKKGSYLINQARGSVVDIDAAAKALRSGHLAGASFDVFPVEPAGHVTDWKMTLMGCPNTILTPHIGGSTEEAQAAIGIEVAGKLIDFVNKGATIGAVNVPEIGLTKKLPPGHTRLLSFHKNRPGVVRDIASIVSVANITSQNLETTDDMGYMVVDLESAMGPSVKDKLDELDGNILCRMLFEGEGYVGPAL